MFSALKSKMIVWLTMFRVFVFDLTAYATITMYFFRFVFDSVAYATITMYFSVNEGDGKGVTLITLNSYVETYCGLLMVFETGIKLRFCIVPT